MYRAHCAAIFAIAQLSCTYNYALTTGDTVEARRRHNAYRSARRTDRSGSDRIINVRIDRVTADEHRAL